MKSLNTVIKGNQKNLVLFLVCRLYKENIFLSVIFILFVYT